MTINKETLEDWYKQFMEYAERAEQNEYIRLLVIDDLLKKTINDYDTRKDEDKYKEELQSCRRVLLKLGYIKEN